MSIAFKNFTHDDVPLYYIWAERPHVKDVWFKPGYEPKEKILDKIDNDDNVYPFLITLEDKPIGFIQYYHVNDDYCWEGLKGLGDGVVGFDIFIGEEEYIGKGYGTKIVQAFTDKLFLLEGVNKIIVDPFAGDKRAIRCYEKAGYNYLKDGKSDTGDEIYIMEIGQ